MRPPRRWTGRSRPGQRRSNIGGHAELRAQPIWIEDAGRVTFGLDPTLPIYAA